MKKTRTLNRLLSFALCLCMVLSLLPIASLNAFAADMTGGEVLYLKPNSNWAADNARFAAYFYGDGNAWESMVPVDGADGIYEVTVPSGSWTNVIFCRMNPSTETNSWDNKWNQSGDLIYDGTNNLCTIHDGQWDCGNNVTWSSYPESDEPACLHDSHSQDGECTACGETVEHTYVDGSCACGAVIEYMNIYFQNNWRWTDVKLHYWGSAAGNPEWPGTAMTLDGNDGYYDIYVLEVPTDIEGITISGTKDDGSGGLDQTPDITDGWYDGICYYMTWNDGNQASSEHINVILPRTYTVNVGGTVTDYTDFDSALSAANAAESAVLTLYQNAPEGFHSFSQGNVTLDLNGMTCEGGIIVYGGTLTLTDSAREKGTVVNYAGSAVTFYEGKLILLETVDLLGLSDGHTPMHLSKGTDGDTVTIGSTGEEDIVLPASIVAIGVVSREETSVVPGNSDVVVLHRHNWIEATCTTSAYCTDCATVGPEAPGHNIGEDGVCTVCGIDPTKIITINMTDGYGDGWNGNAIEIYENGTLVGTATVEDGESATCTYAFDNTKFYSFRWVMGDYPEECAFEILFGEEVVFTATEGVCGDYADGQEIYTTCDHSYGEGVVTAPTCTEAGYTSYTCTVCGSINRADEVAALGHSYGEDGICILCGFDKTKVIIINMTDSYGDGWTDNAIAVYEDGTLVGIATVDVGESATWTCEREADKEYTFYWMRGQFPDECAFEILFGDEVVFTATEDDCDGYADGKEIYTTCDHSYGEDNKCVNCGKEDSSFVAVGDAKLYDGDYLDNNGTVSSTQPTGGYAWYSDGVLTLHDYTYTGKGYVIEAFEMDGETIEATAIVYTALDELSIQLEGVNTLTGTSMLSFGVVVGMADAMDIELGSLVLSGTGTLNLTGYTGIAAGYITLNSGIVNINALLGIQNPNADSSLTVNSGELNVASSGYEDTVGIMIGDVVINGGKVIVSCDGYIALNVSTLTVNGGYLEVVQGGMEVYHPDIDEPIAMGAGVAITAPEGATVGFYTGDYDIIYYTIYDADGNIADAFVIEGPDVEPGGDQEPFDVVVDNQYGTADTVTLSNPVAIPGQDYVTTVSSTVGTGIGVWGVYVAEEDGWYGNGIFEFDEETNTLTVFGDYVAAGMQIEVVPFVTLTTHMNGGSAINDYWEYVFGPDETGTFTGEWAYGEEDYFFYAWDDELGAINPDPNLLFKREGYTVVGYNTAADGSGTAYAVDALHKFTEDVEIYLIWEANSSINLESAALSFKEKIHYNIFFSLGIDETVELADMGLIMFDSLKADGTMEDAIATYSGAVEMNGMYMVATEGVHAKRMGDTIYFRVYAKLADGSYVYSKTVQYSAVTYAEHILSSDKSDSDKALVVAMLNYGAEAQKYFGYNTDSLANAGLTAEQQALVKDYQADLLAPLTKPDSSKAGVFAATGTGFNKLAPAVSFEGSFVLNYFFTPSEAVVGDMTLYYWTAADYEAATELTAENATGSIVMQPGEQYRAILDGIHAKDVDSVVYVAAVYSDGTATHCTGVLAYSIGAYLTSHAAKETNFQAMAQAAAVYCNYCKEYFYG